MDVTHDSLDHSLFHVHRLGCWKLGPQPLHEELGGDACQFVLFVAAFVSAEASDN